MIAIDLCLQWTLVSPKSVGGWKVACQQHRKKKLEDLNGK